MNSVQDTARAVGCPIRRSRDQRSLASPPGFSQRATSFIASQCQGIHQMPFSSLLAPHPTARTTMRADLAQAKSLLELCPGESRDPCQGTALGVCKQTPVAVGGTCFRRNERFACRMVELAFHQVF